MPVAIFGRNFKKLVPVGDFCLVVGEDFLEIPQDYLLCTYYPMFFWKIEKRSRLWSPNAGTYKIDGSTLKNKDD